MPITHVSAQVDFIQRFGRYISRFNTDLYNPWVVVIELLVIGAVVYTVLRFLRGTRGARLVQAVLMILAVSFLVVQVVARELGLDRIGVIYPYFLGGVFLVSLVAFQTELRRMLIRLGETRLFRHWGMGADKVVDAVVRAVAKMSANRVGALIAIERSTELGAIAETGVALDAEVSTELLETVFWHGSALHDLGLIIRRDRVVAAGCQFPLAESAAVDRALGSRHRAAIGVSEEVDAVVIVVSEENGVISVVDKGRMTRNLSPDRLREYLMGALSRPRRGAAHREVVRDNKRVAADGTSQAA